LAILKDPLFSDEARGTVNQFITFKRSKVHPVACAFTDHPVNWTPEKVAQATWWKSMCTHWHSLSTQDKASWSNLAPGVLTGFNYFMLLRGVEPWLPPYFPPAGDNLLFNFIITEYVSPAGDDLTFHLGVP